MSYDSTTEDEFTIAASEDYNTRFPPRDAKKGYIARIMGRDLKSHFAREFLPKTINVARADCPLLVEVQNGLKKGGANRRYRLFLAAADGQVARYNLDEADARWLAQQLDEGRDLAACFGVEGRISPAAAKRELVGQTIETAIDACYAAIGNLPEKDQKKVLAGLKKKLAPPVPPQAESPAVAPQPAEYVIALDQGDYYEDRGGNDWGRTTKSDASNFTQAEAERICGQLGAMAKIEKH